MSEERVLLGISILGATAPDSFAVDQALEGSRVDAAIRLPGEVTTLIEVKTVSHLDGAQLNRHARRWELPQATAVNGVWVSPPSWSFATWADVWRWARHEREQRRSEPVTSFLLDQVAEYLDLQGFAPWAGFTRNDFEIFDAPSPERRLALQNKMSGLWKRVFEELAPAERERLGAIHAGRAGRTRDPAWAQTNRGQKGANLTVELNTQELQLNLVGWDAGQAHAVLRWLTTSDQSEVPPSTELVVWERRARRDHKGTPFWMGAPGTELARFGPEEVASGAFDSWRQGWEANERTEFTALAYHLRRTWARAEVVTLGEQLPGELIGDVRSLLAPLSAINRWGT